MNTTFNPKPLDANSKTVFSRQQLAPPTHSNLPLDQPLEEIKTVTITLQRNHPPRPPILPPQLLRQQQAPIPRDALNPRPNTTLRFERDDLVSVQPVPVVHFLKGLVEAGGDEAGVERGEGGEDAGEEFLEGEGWEMGGEEGVEGGGREGVGGVEADADDGEVFRGGVVRVYEDAADFEVRFFGAGFVGVEGVCLACGGRG